MSYQEITQYRFADQILERVRECYQNDNWHGPLELARHWGVILASMSGSIWMWHNGPAAAGWVTYALAVWFIGGRQRALADILHQAAHKTLIRDQKLGRFLGTFLSGYLILQSFSGYVASHVRDHHGHLGDPSLDPDYIQYQRNGLCGADMTPAAIRRYLIRLASPRVMMSYIAYLVRDRMVPKEENPRERLIRLVYVGGVVSALIISGNWVIIMFYWLVPFVTTQVWIGSLIELTEHYPVIETAPHVDLYVSRNRHCGRLSNFLLGVTPHEGYHLIHHKFAAVPPWRHHEVHQILLQDPVYAVLNSVRGWRAILREVLTLDTRVVELAHNTAERR